MFQTAPPPCEVCFGWHSHVCALCSFVPPTAFRRNGPSVPWVSLPGSTGVTSCTGWHEVNAPTLVRSVGAVVRHGRVVGWSDMFCFLDIQPQFFCVFHFRAPYIPSIAGQCSKLVLPDRPCAPASFTLVLSWHLRLPFLFILKMLHCAW